MTRSSALSLALAPLLAAATAVASEPEIDVSQLDNGLDLIVVQKRDAALVTIEIAVKTGSFTETPDTNGLSHLYEHMFFKGNAALPTQERYMARVRELGISFNGTTSTERVNYFITLPSRNFAEGMRFMSDAILTPLFNMGEMVKEREVVISEYDRNESSPSYYLRRAVNQALYGEEAYRKNPLGERHVILSATQETMRDFQARYYVPNNAALFIVGDVNLTEAKVLAQTLLGVRQWRPGPDPHRPARAPLPRLRETKALVVSEPVDVVGKSKAIQLAAHWNGPDVGRDERATFVADVWGTLAGLPHNRFQKAFRDAGLADGGANIGYYTQREGGEVSFSCSVRDGQVKACRDALLAEVAAMGQAGYWTEEDLALAKRNLRIMRAYEAQSGAALSHNLSFWWASSSIDYYTSYPEECDTVTLAEVQQFVRDYLIGRPMVIACLASPDNVAAHGITPDLLAPPPAGGEAAAAAVEQLTLRNGIPVLLRTTPGSGLTALEVYFAGGAAALDPARLGVDTLLLSTATQASRRTSRDKMQTEFVRLGARPGMDVGYDYTRVSVQAPREGFERAVELLTETLREPLLDPATFEQQRSARLAALENERTRPDDYVPRLVNVPFFHGHPYARRPDGVAETVKALTVDDLRQRLQELLVSGRMLVVVVGDLDRAAATKLLEAQLGFVRKGDFARPEVPAFRPSPPVVFEQRQLPGTYLYAKFAVPAPGHPDYAAARLAIGGVLRARLWASLRTEHAIAYAAGSGMGAFRGNFGIISCANTKDPRKAAQLIAAEVRRLQEELVTAEELQGAIAQEETNAHQRNEGAASHAQGLGHAQLITGRWRDHYDLPLAAARVTPEDVRRVAREYLKDFTWAVLGPAEVPQDLLLGGSGAR
ncbi:MAG: insulinase family protein [Planctomycetes bacterium]|nr:insulinase family protein [Planctomycetota bacterium]